MVYYDAHCHLQDERLRPFIDETLAGYEELSVKRAVVNGTCEADWSLVTDLANQSQLIKPSFGLHPWFVKDRSDNWKEALVSHLANEEAAIGEIGLDRWIEGYDIDAQKEIFLWQLRLAAEGNRPVSIHCLKAWGLLYDLFKKESLPQRGFLLHSYGGPAEMVKPLAKLGACFSFSGYFALDRKEKAREVFLQVPTDRFLVETDAPDMLGPNQCMYKEIHDAEENQISHPLNIVRIYSFAAEMFGLSEERFATVVAENFHRFFD